MPGGLEERLERRAERGRVEDPSYVRRIHLSEVWVCEERKGAAVNTPSAGI